MSLPVIAVLVFFVVFFVVIILANESWYNAAEFDSSRQPYLLFTLWDRFDFSL